MKIVVWVGFGALAALWTVVAFVASELTAWIAQALESGRAADLGEAAAKWPIPAWIGAWIDPALIVLVQDAVLWAVEALRGSAPVVASVIGWLVPVVWVTWGLGVVLLLVLAAGANLLVGRLRARRA